MTPDEINRESDKFRDVMSKLGYAVVVISPEDVVLGTVTDGIVNDERLAIAKPWLKENATNIEDCMTSAAFECILDGHLKFPSKPEYTIECNEGADPAINAILDGWYRVIHNNSTVAYFQSYTDAAVWIERQL